MAASRDRRASIIDDEAEDVDEVTLDAAHEKGLRKVQVSTWLLFEDSTSSVAAKVVQGVLMLLILISTVNMLVESHTACRFEVRSEPPAANAGLGTSHYQRTCDEVTWSPEQTAQFEAIESACIAAFTLEFLLRCFASPATVGLGRFWCNPMNWIDLLAIIPFYLEQILLAVMRGQGGADLGPFAVLRVIRLTRVVRVLKVSKTMRGPVILARTVAKSAVPFLMLMSFVFIAAILCSSLMLSFEKGAYIDGVLGQHNHSYHNYYRLDGDTSSFASFWFVIWWCIQTLTSEGYGDSYPITDAGKVVATFTAVCGMFLLALPITIIGANFDEEYERSTRGAALDRKSRVMKYNALTRNGTRPLRTDRPSLRDRVSRASRKVLPDLSSTIGAQAAAERSCSRASAATPSSRFDAKFEDQAYNVQADISMLLDEHFEAVREKFNALLRRNTDNLNRWVTTDLHYIDAESKTAAQVTSSAVMKFKTRSKSSWPGRPGGLNPDSSAAGGAAAETT